MADAMVEKRVLDAANKALESWMRKCAALEAQVAKVDRLYQTAKDQIQDLHNCEAELRRSNTRKTEQLAEQAQEIERLERRLERIRKQKYTLTGALQRIANNDENSYEAWIARETLKEVGNASNNT